MRHIILGNGAAGVTAAEKLRELSSTDEIIIVSNEEYPAYTKCMLPDYIGKKLDRDKLFIRSFDNYAGKGIDLLLEKKIESVNTQNKYVEFDNGNTLSYDKLLIATGGIPFVPQIEGLEKTRYFTVNSVKDADIIQNEAMKGGKAVVVGGGLTGIEVAFALNRLGMKVSLIERADRILPVQLDVYSSSVLIDRMNREGIEIFTGKNTSRVTVDNGSRLELESGEVLDFDMLIIAIGTRPKIEFLKGTSIQCGRGVLVDEYLRSSVEDVYAAGDAAETMNKLSGGYVSCYIWPNAMAQGKCAAYNMAGQPVEFSSSSVIQNQTLLRDIPFLSMGLINPDGRGYETFVSHDREKGVYKKVVIAGSFIKGMTFIGDTSMANQIGAYIRKGTSIADIKENLLVQLGMA